MHAPTSDWLGRLLLLFVVASSFLTLQALGAAPDLASFREYLYPKDDLGAVYSPQATTIKLWAPTAQSVSVALFADATNAAFSLVPLTRDQDGAPRTGRKTVSNPMIREPVTNQIRVEACSILIAHSEGD
jgi:hypothetical protein